MRHDIHLHLYTPPESQALRIAEALATPDPGPVPDAPPAGCVPPGPEMVNATATAFEVGHGDVAPRAARPLRDWIRDKLVEHAVAAGRDRAKAEALADQMQTERPFIDWLLAGGWQKLLTLFLELLAVL